MRSHSHHLFLILFSQIILLACGPVSPVSSPTAALPPGGTQTDRMMGFALSSNVFTEGGSIPRQYTCDGDNNSPPLAWEGAPAGTESYVLIVDDPDAPSGSFTHWVVFDIPGATTTAVEGAKALGQQGLNGRGQISYTGPCPPNGTHRYFFTLYALNTSSLGIKEGSTRAAVESAIKGRILAKTVLLGKYSR